MNCMNCGIEFKGRKDAKFCSPGCRVTFSRKRSVVTDNVTFKPEAVTDNFEYVITTYDKNLSQPGRKPINEKRSAKYWYDVPLGAQPVLKKDWPKMPDFMNGRQYFLWWKNNFALDDKPSPFDGPVLYDPF